MSSEPRLVLPLGNVAMCTVVASVQGTAGKEEVSIHPIEGRRYGFYGHSV